MSRATKPKNKAAAASANEKVTFTTKEQQNWSPTDTSGKHEFGGPLGMSTMMVGFPLLMYFMWIGAVFYDGQIPRAAKDESFFAFLDHLWFLIKTEAYPTKQAWCIYWSFGLAQLAFYVLLPGVYRKGQALPHLGGKQLDYYCSAMWSFYTSVALGFALHFSGYFRLDTLIGEFGPIMSVAIISGFLCSFLAYFSAVARGATLRMTGNCIVDFFMGAELNPRMFGILDFKMLLEVRIAWFILFFLALSTCLKQFEEYGYVSAQAWFLLLAQYLYAGVCAKGEHLIITTWYANTHSPGRVIDCSLTVLTQGHILREGRIYDHFLDYGWRAVFLCPLYPLRRQPRSQRVPMAVVVRRSAHRSLSWGLLHLGHLQQSKEPVPAGREGCGRRADYISLLQIW